MLCVEVTINQPKALGLKKSLAALPDYRRRMQKMIETFLEVWQAADQCRLTAEALEDLQAPVIQDAMRLPGISLTNRRLLTVLSTSVELAKQPNGFAIAEFYPQVVDRLNEIIQPVLSQASLAKKPGRPPQLSYRDQLYRNLQIDLEALCIDYGLKKAA